MHAYLVITIFVSLSSLSKFDPLARQDEGHNQPAQLTDLYGDPLPRGAIARLGTTAYRHHDSVRGVCLLPDNQTMVLVTEEGDLWRATGKRLYRLEPSYDNGNTHLYISDSAGIVEVVRFSPDNNWLASGDHLGCSEGVPTR